MKYVKKLILETYDDVAHILNAIRKNDIDFFDENYINLANKEYLIYATLYDRVEIAKILIDDGIDVNIVNFLQRTAAFYVSNNKNLDIIEMLLDNNLDFDQEDDWDEIFLDVISNTVSNKLEKNKYLISYYRKKKAMEFNI